MSSIRNIPGYAAAVDAEREARQEAWLALQEPICGIEMAPLTLRKLLYLTLARNHYVSEDARPSEHLYHIGQFLWVCSIHFREGDLKARDRFFKRIRKLELRPVIRGILDYRSQSLFDLAAAASSNHSAPKTDWISGMIHRFASSYSWTPDRVLDMPIRQLIQLDRCAAADDPETRKRLSNPMSDKILMDHLQRLNAKPPRS